MSLELLDLDGRDDLIITLTTAKGRQAFTIPQLKGFLEKGMAVDMSDDVEEAQPKRSKASISKEISWMLKAVLDGNQKNVNKLRGHVKSTLESFDGECGEEPGKLGYNLLKIAITDVGYFCRNDIYEFLFEYPKLICAPKELKALSDEARLTVKNPEHLADIIELLSQLRGERRSVKLESA